MAEGAGHLPHVPCPFLCAGSIQVKGTREGCPLVALLGAAMLEKFDLAVAHGHALCQSDCE